MATGYLTVGQCYPTVVQAAQQLCSTIVQSPSTNTVQFCTGATYGVYRQGTTSTLEAQLTITQWPINSTAAPSSRVILIPLQPCDLSTALTPFDYTYASGIWTLAFTFVVGVYLIAKNAGLILALIRGQ